MEAVFALGIFSLLSGGAAYLVINAFRTNSLAWDTLSAQSYGRRALQEVIDDLRRAEQSNLGSYPLEYASGTEVRFYANLDEDSLREKVKFWLEDGFLKKGVIKPTGDPLTYSSANEQQTIVAGDIVNSGPIFYFYGEDYTGSESSLAEPVDVTLVRMAKVSLEIEKNPLRNPNPLRVESMVQIRSLKAN